MAIETLIGTIAVFLTLGVFIFTYIISQRLQIHAYRAEKLSEQLFELHRRYYSHLEFSAFALSKWIVIGLADFLKAGDFSETVIQKITYYLVYFLNHRTRLLKYTAGIYDLEGEDNAYYVVKLSEEIIRELRKDFDEDDIEKLTELVDAEDGVTSFKDFRSRLAKSLPAKTKKAIEKLVKNRGKKIEKLLRFYSEILMQDRYSLYDAKVDNRSIKVLHKQTEYILNVDEEKEKMEEKIKKLKRDCELLPDVVNELRNTGYKDNQICTTKDLRDEILIFEKNRVFNKFLFRKKFPWVIFVKKSKKWQDLPVELFQYTTKFKYIKHALTESQKLKEKLDKELENLYDKEVGYGSTKIKCAFITAGIVTLVFGVIVSSWQIELLKIINEHKLQVIVILVLLAGICFLSIGIFLFPKRIKRNYK